jgi:hypothetical protein
MEPFVAQIHKGEKALSAKLRAREAAMQQQCRFF